MADEIKVMFDQYGGVMRTKELMDHGFSDRKIKKLIVEGLVEQIRRGYYQYVGDGTFTEAAVIARLFPDGVLCMESALDYYEYTERTPSAWHIAVADLPPAGQARGVLLTRFKLMRTSYFRLWHKVLSRSSKIRTSTSPSTSLSVFCETVPVDNNNNLLRFTRMLSQTP